MRKKTKIERKSKRETRTVEYYLFIKWNIYWVTSVIPITFCLINFTFEIQLQYYKYHHRRHHHHRHYQIFVLVVYVSYLITFFLHLTLKLIGHINEFLQ